MITPLRPLEEIRLPSGGTTNTGVTVPLLPVGLLAWPVAESTNAVPPISLAYESPAIARPLRRLGTADVPAGLVPIRLSWMVLSEDPNSVMPFPPFPEITLETAPDLPDGFSPIVLAYDPPPRKPRPRGCRPRHRRD